MARLLRMPEIAANTAEAVLQDWTVDEHGRFAARQTIATVETDKAVVDVEADADGVLLSRLVAPGTSVPVGTPIAVLGDPDEQVGDLGATLAGLGVAASPAATPAVPLLAAASPAAAPPAATPPATLPATPPVTPAAASPAAMPPPGGTTGEPSGRVFASPLARRLAREVGLATEALHGTGPGGRVLRRDVQAAQARRSAGRPVPVDRVAAAGSAPQPAEPQRAPATVPYRDVPHSRMRRAVADRLARSKQTVPHFYLRATIDVRRLLSLRAELNDAGGPAVSAGAAAGTGVTWPKVSVNDLVVKAVARAHTLVPEMNVSWSPAAVRHYTGVDVAVAVATERGLVTPVVRGVAAMSVPAVALAIRDLAGRARAGTLRQSELEGGSITVTNLGMYGTEEFAAIINPPQAAILAVGAIHEEPIARDGRLRVRRVLRVTLSVDHRPVDGVVAARWLRAFVTLMERPARILA